MLGGVGLQGTWQYAVSTCMTAPCGGTQQTSPGAHGRWKGGSIMGWGIPGWRAHISPSRAGPLAAGPASAT
jgi:hypothetical protein